MQRIAYFLGGSILGAFIAVAALQAANTPARDAVEVSPEYYSIPLENDRVRVLDYHLKPGQTERMHSHRAGVAYIVSGAKIRTISANGESQEGVLQAGDVHWRANGVTHAVENVGKTEEHAIIVELKDHK